MRRYIPDLLVVGGIACLLFGLYVAFGTFAAPLIAGGVMLAVYGALLDVRG